MKLLNYYGDVVSDYICLCAYMLLVNFLTCYWCWIVGVSMYWNMLVWIIEVVWIYALLLLSLRSTHSWCRISYPCWWRILCIQLFGVITMFLLHHGVTTSEVIWYHVSRCQSRRIACLGWVIIVYILVWIMCLVLCVFGEYLWSMNHMLVENCWWPFGDYVKMCICWCLLWTMKYYDD